MPLRSAKNSNKLPSHMALLTLQRRCVTFVIALLFFLLPPATAPAQSRLGPAESRPELPEREEKATTETASGRILKPISIPADDPAAHLFAGGTITVRGFRFVGNEALSDEKLNAVTQFYVGEGRRYGALLEARDRVTRAYIDAGYISSGAVLSDQPVEDGVVELQIIEGLLTTIEVESDGRLRDHYLLTRLGLVGQNKALNLGTLHQRLRILKRDPNIETITSELVPGDERGESILSVKVNEPAPWSLSASVDDYVTPAIGGFRGTYMTSYRNLSGWGEHFTATYSVATGLHDIDGQLSIPITRWDTVLELRARRAWSEITERPIDVLEIESRSESYSLRIQQPVLRQRTYNLGLFASAEWKRGKSTLLGGLALSLDPQDDGRSTVSAVRAGIEGWWQGDRRAFSGRLTLSRGLDILDAGSDGLDLDGDFYSGLLQIQGVEYLPWYGMRLLTRVDGQLAEDVLLGLEQFSLGGHASVRGYRENLLVRDQGVVGSVELRIPLPVTGPFNRLELGVFSDGGYTVNRHAKSGDRIWSAGLGLHASVNRYVRFSAEWARSLNDPNGNLIGNHIQDDGVHFTLQAGFP
jgi:hemolysin activation/secretion protein